MNTLADLLNFVVSSLQASSLFHTVRIVETHPFSRQQFALKVRAEMQDGEMLQIRLYRNFNHLDYAYQFIGQDQRVLRWDNKEHFPFLDTHPHHFHTSLDQVAASPLKGDPLYDLPVVLDYLKSIQP